MTQAVTFSNRYQLDRAIARGGMAQVYLANDQLLERPVAIKVLFPEFARDPSFVERFRREAQAAANLNHPNIVAIYDWGQERGTYYIVMEFIEGPSLRDMIRAEGRIRPEQASEIGAEIAGALAFAHRNGVVHRDVKPGNVLMTASGQVKVTDFGIARATRADSGEALTQTGAVMGTATYFSPEQAQGLPVDGRSDVYSLGVVLYEMVTGETPFTGDTPVAVAYKHVREAPDPPSQRVPDVPSDLEQIILGALAKEVDSRYQSADDLRDDLVRFTSGRPPAAVPITAQVAETTGPTTPATQAMAPVRRDYDDDAYSQSRRRTGKVVGGVIAGIIGVALVIGVILLLAGVFSRDDTAAATVDVPNVVGQQFDQAAPILEELGLEVERNDVANARPANEILAQDPPEGEKLEEGETVALEVSEPAVAMPNVVGQECTAAVEALRGLGVLGECVEEDSDLPPGTVIRTEPPVGSLVPKDGMTVVRLIQARQPEVTIPAVENQDANAVQQVLEQSGLAVTQTTENHATIQPGRATRTDPPAGTTVKKGDPVTLYVSSGPAQVDVPSTVGMTQEQAEDELLFRGFNVLVMYEASSPEDNGRVVNQNPSGGQAPQGSVVTIVVGQV